LCFVGDCLFQIKFVDLFETLGLNVYERDTLLFLFVFLCVRYEEASCCTHIWYVVMIIVLEFLSASVRAPLGGLRLRIWNVASLDVTCGTFSRPKALRLDATGMLVRRATCTAVVPPPLSWVAGCSRGLCTSHKVRTSQ
jgi:hypothetical protein